MIRFPANSQVVFVNFYADWCRFSQNLKPVFEEASKRVSDTPDIVFASVDSDRERTRKGVDKGVKL